MTKPLPPPLRHQEYTILRVRIRKGNGAALPYGVPELQRTEEKAETRSRSVEDEDGKTTRRPEDIKAHAGIHQSNRQTRNIRGKGFMGRIEDESSCSQE